MAASDHDAHDVGPTGAPAPTKRRRSLRAVFAADISGFSGRMSLSETNTLDALVNIRAIGMRALDTHDGWLFGMPRDGLFATFESAVGAVQCALDIQRDLAANPRLRDMQLRIGIHLGEVLLDNDIPYGETLNIAARLEALADPGGILVSGPVMDAVASRLSATFEARGTPVLKNIPRRLPTFAVTPPPARWQADSPQTPFELDRTTRVDRQPAPSGPSASVPPTPQTPATQPEPYPDPILGPSQHPLPAAHLPLDEIARAARDAAAARENRLDRLLSESESTTAPDTPPQPVVEAEPAAAQVAPEPIALAPELVDQITKALAAHIGPFARMIVQKHLASPLDAFGLIKVLEQHIPTEEERVAFRLRAAGINGAFGGGGNTA